MRHDFTEFLDPLRIRRWRDHVPAHADTAVLMDEALGHAVGLRDELAASGQQTERALYLVAVLNQLRDSMAPETSGDDSGPA
jgi:hypothetical protein